VDITLSIQFLRFAHPEFNKKNCVAFVSKNGDHTKNILLSSYPCFTRYILFVFGKFDLKELQQRHQFSKSTFFFISCSRRNP